MLQASNCDARLFANARHANRVWGAREVASRQKIYLRTHGSGLPVAVERAPGQASDYRGTIPLLDADGPEPKMLIADRGYDANWLRETMEACAITPIIPTRMGRKIQVPVDGDIYALRNRIERCFNILRNARRLPTRYDKKIASYLSLVQIASICLWTREFVNRS